MSDNQTIFNDRLKQVLVLLLIFLITALLITELVTFLPGILGGITLYILSRGYYFQMIFKRKMKRGTAALLFILGYILILAIPIYLSITLITPKVQEIAQNQDKIIASVEKVAAKVQERFGFELLSQENIRTGTQKISQLVPKLLTGTATMLGNLVMMFFLLYFMLVGGRDMEKNLSKIIPLKPQNVDILAGETKMMIKANALGIPIICVVQGIFAAIGYWIFGMEDWALWGFVTGIFAFFPLVGTMIIWVPIVIYMLAQGQTWQGVALAGWSAIIMGNVDYVARISFMKRIGDVHPLITVLGVIVGLNLFGFIGLIFGPLLISYFLILVKIYINEFSTQENPPEIIPKAENAALPKHPHIDQQ